MISRLQKESFFLSLFDNYGVIIIIHRHLKYIVKIQFVHINLHVIQICFFMVLDIPGPSWNDSGSILNQSFFRQNFCQNRDLCPYFSTCLFHRFEVWDMQSKLK